MMRCNSHRRDFLGDCMWCGKKLCEFCIAKQEGRKYYCEHCAVRLVPFKRDRLPALSAQPLIQPVAPAPAVKRRFMLGKDGYVELR